MAQTNQSVIEKDVEKKYCYFIVNYSDITEPP